MARGIDVYLEIGRTRTFACALAWPGWARSAATTKGEEAALEELLAYADRYAEVVTRAGLALPARRTLTVVERLPGTNTTDFGAPDAQPEADIRQPAAAALGRQVDLLEASWALLDEVQAQSSPELRKGPRGGGRDRDDVVRHVVEAERAYASKFGVRHRPFDPADHAARNAMRAELATSLRTGSPDQSWSATYALRRAAWHVLDHAWEIQDKSG
jgi:hypothetical protein